MWNSAVVWHTHVIAVCCKFHLVKLPEPMVMDISGQLGDQTHTYWQTWTRRVVAGASTDIGPSGDENHIEFLANGRLMQWRRSSFLEIAPHNASLGNLLLCYRYQVYMWGQWSLIGCNGSPICIQTPPGCYQTVVLRCNYHPFG